MSAKQGNTSGTLVWFRRDLRLRDNPAWYEAVRREAPIYPVFLPDDPGEENWSPGSASRWWLHHALTDLDQQLRELGSRLLFRRGEPATALRSLIREVGIDLVLWNRVYEPEPLSRDTTLRDAVLKAGAEVRISNASLLLEAWTIQSSSGEGYRVYTPFRKAVLSQKTFAEPLPKPGSPSVPAKWPKSESLASLALLPRIPWDKGIAAAWNPTRQGALERLRHFFGNPVRDYAEARDYPDHDGTSRLSPYLHFGQIGPREIAARIALESMGKGREIFLHEILWREFAHHVLFHAPASPAEPLRENFRRFPWRKDADDLRVWQRGETGYPLVDAGMRQLWKTGWLHNRVRMVVASFLVKHLLISWREGAAWFWDTLVDADLASNTLGWQWAAGCGADAAPYFRIFNPIIQSEKFDSAGDYIRRHVPELAQLPAPWIHRPWEASRECLCEAGVQLGKDYPYPRIDHKKARQRALDALASISG